MRKREIFSDEVNSNHFFLTFSASQCCGDDDDDGNNDENWRERERKFICLYTRMSIHILLRAHCGHKNSPNNNNVKKCTKHSITIFPPRK